MFKNKFVISLIGIYIFWLCVLPVFITNAIVFLCEKKSYNSNFQIELVEPHTRFSLLPIANFYAKEIIVKAKNKSLDVKLDDFKISLRLLPLLSGKFHVNNLSGKKVTLSTMLAEDLELDKDFFKRLNNIYLKIDAISLGEFEAQFFQNEIRTPIIYRGKAFNYQRKNRYVKFNNNSMLDVNGNVSKVITNMYLPKNNDINKTVFDIEISNVNIAPLRDYFKHYLPKDLLELNGIIDINANKNEFITTLSNCEIVNKDFAKSIFFPNILQIKSKFNISQNNIVFDDVDINSKNIHVSLNGKLSDYFGKTMPTLNLNIRVDKSKIEDIINLLPAFQVEEMDVYSLKKYKFFGDVLANISIKGRLPEPDIIGDVYIDNGVLIKPIPNTTKGATIKLNLAGKHANFDVVVPAGGLEKVFVKGSQEIYNIKYADLTVKSTSAVDLKVAETVLNPLHEILNFIIGPVPIMDINGKGNIDILVKGNRKNPHIWGVFNVKNGEAHFLEAPNFRLTNLDAILKFNDQSATFVTQKASLDNKEFSLNGICDLFGKFDFDVKSENQATKFLYNSLKSSTIVPEVGKMLPELDAVNGLTNFDLKIFGTVRNINDIRFNQNVFSKGLIELRDNNFVIQNVEVDKTNGILAVDGTNAEANFSATVGNLPLNLKSKIKNEIADLLIDIPKLNSNLLISDENTRKKQYLPYISVKSKYYGSIKNIDFKKLDFKSTILGSIPSSNIKYQKGGIVNLSNNKLIVKNVKGYINNIQNTFDINLNISELFNNQPDINGNIKLKTPDLSLYNEILTSDILPEPVRNIVKDYEFKKGALDFNSKIQNGKINAYTDLTGINFVYLPNKMPVEIINGSIQIRNNTLGLNKINLLADNMPVLADGEIKDIFNKQNFDLYFNSKPQQEFIDKYINKNQIYPIKIKGDIVYWVRLKGVPNDYDMKAHIDMSKDSSIYHFGATIGDLENSIEASIDSRVVGRNVYKIKTFSYDKMIDSQSGRKTKLNLLKAWGGVKVLEDDLAFQDLHIKTSHPTDARIFNIIFRKPNIKQGQFSSDLKINGKLSNAKVLGDFHIFETNIPFLDTTMKNIELVFKDKIIEFNSKGDIMGNDIVFNGVLKNKLSLPYKIEKADLYTKDLDLNQIVDKIKTAGVDSISTFESIEGFDLTSVIADNFRLKADNIKLRNIHATDFESLISISEKGNFDVKDFKFNIAQGALGGKFSYNLKNNDMGINLKADSISANDITWALFDLKDQIYGDLTGNVNLTCNGADFNQCMETLSGNTIFNVKDGKMPKLGSLEYLLKAGNLVKGGLTGLSINNVIDLIAPSKTGEFSDIFGSIRIKDGVARNIEITTKGKDLSLFISGTYNFATSIADMEVLGLLSRKISTMLGPIGNLSINTLFNVIPGVDLSKDSLVLERINKIPGIELSSKEFRKFIAEIKGNINGDDYVTSFKWIN